MAALACLIRMSRIDKGLCLEGCSSRYAAPPPSTAVVPRMVVKIIWYALKRALCDPDSLIDALSIVNPVDLGMIDYTGTFERSSSSRSSTKYAIWAVPPDPDT